MQTELQLHFNSVLQGCSRWVNMRCKSVLNLKLYVTAQNFLHILCNIYLVVSGWKPYLLPPMRLWFLSELSGQFMTNLEERRKGPRRRVDPLNALWKYIFSMYCIHTPYLSESVSLISNQDLLLHETVTLKAMFCMYFLYISYFNLCMHSITQRNKYCHQNISSPTFVHLILGAETRSCVQLFLCIENGIRTTHSTGQECSGQTSLVKVCAVNAAFHLKSPPSGYLFMVRKVWRDRVLHCALCSLKCGKYMHVWGVLKLPRAFFSPISHAAENTELRSDFH